jgi:hypothetical protein
VWQFAAATQTVDPPLTRATLKHFTACVALFYIGVAGLGRMRTSAPFWLPVIAGLVWVLWTGFDQRLWGLEATRNYFLTYELPKMTDVPAELLKRINSRRIFATFVYPNALAGALLLVVPPALAAVSQLTRWLTVPSRCFILGTLALGSGACLVWSGSKSAWLIALGAAVYALLRAEASRRWRTAIVAGVLVLGLAGFTFQFAGYFKRGATSVSARFEYWRAALRIGMDNPAMGSGPGTFSVMFARIKTPEAEMARLVHNDYLEQFSDSGAVGFLAYASFIAGSVILLHRRLATTLQRAVWIGCAAWAAHGMVDFTLYIPAIAWLAFLLLGWLWGATGAEDPQAQPGRRAALPAA